MQSALTELVDLLSETGREDEADDLSKQLQVIALTLECREESDDTNDMSD